MVCSSKSPTGRPCRSSSERTKRFCFLSPSVLEGFNPKRPRTKLHSAILDGSISGALTVYKVGKLKRTFPLTWLDIKGAALHKGTPMKLYVLIYDPRSYSESYRPLFDLMTNHGMHFGDLSWIIAAVEYGKPLLPDDDQHSG